MTRVLLVCLLVAVWVCMGDALLRSATHKPLRERAKDYMAALMEARDAAINGRRLKRQSTDCDTLLRELGEPPYTTCFEDLQSILPGNPGVTIDVVNTYCSAEQARGGCPDLMRAILTALDIACGGGDSDDPLTKAIIESCTDDPIGIPCAVDYSRDFNETFLQNYNTCVDEYDGGKGCTDTCKQVTRGLIYEQGCCYTTLEHYLSTDLNEKVIDSKVFEACGFVEPDVCNP